MRTREVGIGTRARVPASRSRWVPIISTCAPYGGPCDPWYAGKNWGIYTANVHNYLVANNFSWQVSQAAAGDFETNGHGENPPWDCATKTRAFVDGFTPNNSSLATMYDYGDAWGSAGCWSDDDIGYVAWTGYEAPLPEIYTQQASDRWVNVRLTHFMQFQGTMSECQTDPGTGDIACLVNYGTYSQNEYAPNGAWLTLWNELNANGVGQSTMDFATNIKFGQ
jgi:hypothetical protein